MALSACGGSSPGTGGGAVDRGDGGSDESDGGAEPGADGSREDDAAAPLLDGATESDADGADGASACKTECAEDDCGEAVSDGCGGLLKCEPTCPDGQQCGVLRRDKCDYPKSDCTPTPAAEACQGKCGWVSDGCSSGYACNELGLGVMCAADEVCGGVKHDATEANKCIAVEAPTCTPIATSCAELFQKLKATTGRTEPLECGQIGTGCGEEILDCNKEIGCRNGEICRFGDYKTDPLALSCEPPPAPTCTAELASKTCAGKCGTVLNNCDEPVNCTGVSPACPAGQTCGGGGVQNVCGTGNTCTKTPIADACRNKCGFVSDGCSGGYDCTATNGGLTCNGNAGESCGTWGGVPNKCGKPPCQPSKTVEEVCAPVDGHKSCANGVDDGCGTLINCGGCAIDEQCGINNLPDLCSKPVLTCTPIPEAIACKDKCGTVSDGCGNGKTYNCNTGNGGLTCAASEYCGSAGGQTNRCVPKEATCTPKSCAQLGHTCGMASDGCGKQINCWPGCSPTDLSCSKSCGTGAACISNQTSGAQSCVAGGPTCVGSLCSAVPTTCSATSPTKLTGTVRTPGRQANNGTWTNRLPVPNAIVYIPASPSTALPTIFEGVQAGNAASCGRCEDEKLVADGQSVLAAAVTNFKGEFTLEGRIPVGVAFQLVVKVGKWRRVIEVPATVASACAEQALSLDYTRLPAHKTDGASGTHLPKIAISTGNVDEMECVFRDLGFADSEFTIPSANGRLHMYRANGARMGTCRGTYRNNDGDIVNCSANSNAGCADNRSGCTDDSVADSALFNATRLDDYDLVVWDCEGGEAFEPAAARQTVVNYVNGGGRMFASHFSYTWIEANNAYANPLDASAEWTGNDSDGSATALLSMPSGTNRRTGANAVKTPVFRDWLDWQGALTGSTAGRLTTPTPSSPQFAIKDPRDHAGTWVGPATDEWVYRVKNNTSRVQQLSFNTPYAASEANICGRVAYSGFHVANATDNNRRYFPAICSGGELSAQEKVLAFMLFDLATCVSSGDPPTPPACTPKTAANTCPNENDACGYLPDGCGGTIDCGICSPGYYCDGTSCKQQQCTPATCSSLGFNCGMHADGCGGIARNSQGVEGCGECTGGQVCGLGGAGLCGGTNCTPIPSATACAGKNCGSVSNGCGGTYTCGTCPNNQVCGGGGAPNVCGSGACTQIPKATACANKNCGSASDGCGGSYDCGTCTAPDSCGGGGKANVCGHPTCTPTAKGVACAGKQCGWVSDGCNGAILCGTCEDGGVCGGAGPNLCGSSCTPTTCALENAQCGAISNECGGVLNCGSCTKSGEVCGARSPNKCDTGTTCKPLTCADVGAQCGLVGDGCNGVLDCGACTVAGQTCGGAGKANQCGTGTGGCNKLTCESQNVQCGSASDGCGGLLDCGGCGAGYACKASKCELLPPVLQ